MKRIDQTLRDTQKVIVRFSLPAKRTPSPDIAVQIKAIVRYNDKRLSFPINVPDYAVLPLFFAFTPEGRIKPEAEDYIKPKDRKRVRLYSKMLLNLSEAVRQLISIAIERNAWGRMTSDELRSFAIAFDWNDKTAEITNKDAVIGENGIFETWVRQGN